jgi:hypothetical protein
MMDAFSCSIQKNAHRIFYVHINRLLVHIGAFDPIHIDLLLSAKHTILAEGGDSSTAPCVGIAIESDARVCYMVLSRPVAAVGFLSHDHKEMASKTDDARLMAATLS